MSLRIREAEPADHPLLVDIWLRSVRATHTFLTEADIQSLLPIVRDTALANLELWVLSAGDSEPAEVNEQNTETLKFYLASGFSVVGRSNLDRDGRAFPLLQMREVAVQPSALPIEDGESKTAD